MSTDNTSSRQAGDYREDHQPESDIDVAHPTDPNTVDTTVTCPACERSVSKRADGLVGKDGCLWCRGDGQ